ncbi:MAG: alpha/beta hydrolase, partial [bacterium]
RIGEHRILVKTARYLCLNGYACLRFDFRGSGESEGDFSEITLETEMSDAKTAVEFARSHDEIDPERIALLGQSLGGTIAICIAAEVKIASLVLWSPTVFADYLVERNGEVLIDPYVWLPPSYKEELRRTGKVDVGGLTRGKGFFESLTSVDPLASLGNYHGPVVIICGSEDEVVSPINSDIIYGNVPGQKKLVVIVDADHNFSSSLWETQVIHETCEWLKTTLM